MSLTNALLLRSPQIKPQEDLDNPWRILMLQRPETINPKRHTDLPRRPPIQPLRATASQTPRVRHIQPTNRTDPMHPITNSTTRCLLKRHAITTVVDLIHTSARLCMNILLSPHNCSPNCTYDDYPQDRTNSCKHPHECTTEALARTPYLSETEPAASGRLTRVTRQPLPHETP
jgi:hypothetical protein